MVEKVDKVTKVTMLVGNVAEPVQRMTRDPVWAWRVFLRAGSTNSQHIDKIVVHLHPTFQPSSYEYEQCDEDGCFWSGRFTGWGVFNVRIVVCWRDGATRSEINHQLSFDDGGSSAQIQLEVPARLLLAKDEREDEHAAFAACACGPDVDYNAAKQQAAEALAKTPFLPHDDVRFFHGRAYGGPRGQEPPRATWVSSEPPRRDHDAPAWLTATEFEDYEEVMDAKCLQLAQLIRMSRKTVVYSGAGISVAACIGQAAAGSSSEGGRWSDALPTKTHFALGELGKQGLIHGWVQQNHDGLPQKSGFPQECINEIHGSWYDPSNPVVLYSGTLKEDAYPWMKRDAKTADLVIVVGTSLGGLNADQVPLKTADRSLVAKPWNAEGGGGALGTVMINLQQTPHDGKSTLRIFGTTDTVLPRVLEKLGLGQATDCKCGKRFCRERNGYMYRSSSDNKREEHAWNLMLPDAHGVMRATSPATFPKRCVAVVPYDRQGRRSSTARMRLDLSVGARVRITPGHNIQGAGQPAYLHIGADEPYTRPRAYGGQTMRNGPGHGAVLKHSAKHGCYDLVIEGVKMKLGLWWLDAAQRGVLSSIPVVNIDPEMEQE